MKTFEPDTFVSFTGTTQAKERKRPCEDDIWDPREEPSRDDPDIGMDAVEQITLLEGAEETASSTDEIPYGETAGSSQFKRARLEEPPLDDEQEKNWEDDASPISLEETLMTKNPVGPTTSTRGVTRSKETPAFICLRVSSGHLIGMIIVHVDDILLATGQQSPGKISHLPSLQRI